MHFQQGIADATRGTDHDIGFVVQRLKDLRGVRGQLPARLPPLLETLEYVAWTPYDLKYDCKDTRQLDTAAQAISRLQHLKWLAVRLCSYHCLPVGLVTQLPLSLQVKLTAIVG